MLPLFSGKTEHDFTMRAGLVPVILAVFDSVFLEFEKLFDFGKEFQKSGVFFLPCVNVS